MNVLNKQQLDTVEVGTIADGEVFVDDGEPFLVSDADAPDGEGYVAAVNLRTGEMWCFTADELVVHRPDAELVLP